MTSDKQRDVERAREFLEPYFDMLDALGPAKMNRDAHSAKLVALLNSVRLDEMKLFLGFANEEKRELGDFVAYIIHRVLELEGEQQHGKAKE